MHCAWGTHVCNIDLARRRRATYVLRGLTWHSHPRLVSHTRARALCSGCVCVRCLFALQGSGRAHDATVMGHAPGQDPLAVLCVCRSDASQSARHPQPPAHLPGGRISGAEHGNVRRVGWQACTWPGPCWFCAYPLERLPRSLQASPLLMTRVAPTSKLKTPWGWMGL